MVKKKARTAATVRTKPSAGGKSAGKKAVKTKSVATKGTKKTARKKTPAKQPLTTTSATKKLPAKLPTKKSASARQPTEKKSASTKIDRVKKTAAKKAARRPQKECDLGCPKGSIKPRFINPVPEESKSIEAERTRRWKELMPQYEKGMELIRRYGPSLVKYPEITGIHVGFKRIKNRLVRPLEYCIRISVRRKRPIGDSRIVKLLPKSIQGFPIDVFERTYETIADSMAHGPTRFRSAKDESLPHNNTILDPLRGGIVIADKETPDNWGTLGLIGKGQGGKRYGLTCAHVAGNTKHRVAVVTHPVRVDRKTEVREIGKVALSARNSSVDASVIEIDSELKVRRQAIVFGKNNYLAGSIDFGTAIPEFRAFKIGAATDPNTLVHGRIQITTGVIEIKGFGIMTDQIVVVNDNGDGFELIRPGDSGAVLLMMTDEPDIFVVVGLVHAKTSDGAMVACPWNKVLEHFPLVQF